MSKPVLFVGSQDHAMLRRVGCERAGIPFSYHPIQWWKPDDVLIKLLKTLKRQKASVVVLEEIDESFWALARILSLNTKHTFVRYGDRAMDEALLAELSKMPRTVYIHKHTPNQDFVRLVNIVGKASDGHGFNYVAKYIVEEGFIHATQTASSDTKDLILYYHKIWPSRSSWISTNFEDHEKKVLRVEDLVCISRMFFREDRRLSPLGQAEAAYYATQMALRAAAHASRRKYVDVYAKLLKVDTETLQYWDKWQFSTHNRFRTEARSADQSHGIGWPTAEYMESGVLTEEYHLFGLHIESVKTTPKETNRTYTVGPKYDELIQSGKQSIIADRLLSYLVDRGKFKEFGIAFENARKRLGNSAVLKRFAPVTENLKAMKSMIEVEE